MSIFGASEAKNEFGRLLDTAQREKVVIEKKGRPVAVLLSIQEYERLEKAEDQLWLSKAQAAEAEGFLELSETEALLKSIRHAEA